MLLADATHQPDGGWYTLWHAIAVDTNGLGRLIFYSLIPNESAASYHRATNAIKDILPSKGSVKTIVLDRS